MNNKVIYNVSLSAKQLSDFSGKSINTCKKFLRDLTANLTSESDAGKGVEENIVTADLTASKDEQYVEPVYDWQQMVERKVEPQTYTPTPVEPPVYPETTKPKFDFAQMASQSLQDNKTESKSDYWRRLRASMGDVD